MTNKNDPRIEAVKALAEAIAGIDYKIDAIVATLLESGAINKDGLIANLEKAADALRNQKVNHRKLSAAPLLSLHSTLSKSDKRIPDWEDFLHKSDQWSQEDQGGTEDSGE
jgi:hypothetical protein